MFYKNILIGYDGIIISNSIRGKCHMKKYIIFLNFMWINFFHSLY